MLCLRGCILPSLLSSPATPLHRLLSAAAPAVSPSPPSFAVEEYLVATCGLTPAQARKASPKLSHLKSPANPDAVLAFLAGLGLSAADVANAVRKDPVALRGRGENPGSQRRGAHQPGLLAFRHRAPRLAHRRHFPLQVHHRRAALLLAPLRVLREPPSSPQEWLRSRV
ncbi:hypothetical protein ACQJBY_039190 [Aegilops geniculata]